MASAYIFVHLMPELHGAREAFAESASEFVPYEGLAIYFVALVGFLVMYGLEHMRQKASPSHERDDSAGEMLSFRFHVASFALYVLVMGYLLVHSLEESSVSVLIYAIAIAFHFLSIDHELRREYGHLYDRRGAYVLAGAALAGWGLGAIFALPLAALALLVALVSGAVIMNSAVMELPSDKDGRFWPFLTGGIVYGLILLPLG